jgi:hypothetical protein
MMLNVERQSIVMLSIVVPLWLITGTFLQLLYSIPYSDSVCPIPECFEMSLNDCDRDF